VKDEHRHDHGRLKHCHRESAGQFRQWFDEDKSHVDTIFL